jgi:hypothetical protein
MAWHQWNRPWAAGMVPSSATLAPPADSPNRVTFSGSPPNAAMWLRTQRSAASWSCSPRLAVAGPSGAPNSLRSRKPSSPSRYCSVTTTIGPAQARRAPSYQWLRALPSISAPPWIHTITGSGRCASAGRSGVHTLSVRQSSCCTLLPLSVMSAPASCGAAGPWSSASFTPSHAGTGCGRRQRSAPTGACAWRMPRKTWQAPS